MVRLLFHISVYLTLSLFYKVAKVVSRALRGLPYEYSNRKFARVLRVSHDTEQYFQSAMLNYSSDHLP